jgi:hypothetical protein
MTPPSQVVKATEIHEQRATSVLTTVLTTVTIHALERVVLLVLLIVHNAVAEFDPLMALDVLITLEFPETRLAPRHCAVAIFLEAVLALV